MANTFTPRNRLSEALSDDGISRSEAAAGAQASLEDLRGESLAELGRTLDLIDQIAAPIAAWDDPAVDELYACASRIVAIAGAFALHEVSGQAYALCEAISRMQDEGAWRAAAIAECLTAIRDARAD